MEKKSFGVKIFTFFFQAEDGIRDDLVTGVQTCALPIWWSSGYGRLIKIQHEFGIETRYAHLSQIRVSAGERVTRGQHIGDQIGRASCRERV